MVHKCAYSEFHFPSMKMLVFVDGNRKIGLPSIKMPDFMDGK